MNSGAKLAESAKALVIYQKDPKPAPSPGSARAKLLLERFMLHRTHNLEPRLSLAAAAGIIDSLSRLHPGRACNVLHLILSPHPDERLSEREWDLSWEVYRRELCLQNHFAIRVRHGDGHTGYRERHGTTESLVHEHGVLSLIHPLTLRRMDMTDLYQRLEIADAYVEGRFGKPRERARPIALKPEQHLRLREMRELGALHRAMDARGEPVTLPAPPNLEQERRDNRRRRYLRDKSLASQILGLVADLAPLPRSWEGLRGSLAERGLEYRIGVFKPGLPPRYSGRIHVKDDRGSRRGVAAATVDASLGLDALVKILGPHDAPDQMKPVQVRRNPATPLPSLQGIETLPQAIELLEKAGCSYELRLHRTKLGNEAVVGYVRDEQRGKLRRAAGEWALSNLKRRFGAEAVAGLSQLPTRIRHDTYPFDAASQQVVAKARGLPREGTGLSRPVDDATLTPEGTPDPYEAVTPTLSTAARPLRRPVMAADPTPFAGPDTHVPATPKLGTDSVTNDVEAEELPTPEGSAMNKSPTFSM